MISILDYGMANLRSVQKAFERLGHAARIISSPEEVKGAERLVVPGVGAFRDAIALLDQTGLSEAIREHVQKGRPLMGICLGLQLLMDVGYEDGTHKGLGIIPGACVRFTVDQPPLHLKVPHMGWNALQFAGPTPLFNGISPGAYVYFVHSYHVVPREPEVIAATADYGGEFVAAIAKDNVVATQFHPEKSQDAGAMIFRNFAEFSGDIAVNAGTWRRGAA